MSSLCNCWIRLERVKEPIVGGGFIRQEIQGAKEISLAPFDQTVTNWRVAMIVQLSQVVSLIDAVISVIINRSVHTDNSLTIRKIQYKHNYRIPPLATRTSQWTGFLSRRKHVTWHPRHDSDREFCSPGSSLDAASFRETIGRSLKIEIFATMR